MSSYAFVISGGFFPQSENIILWNLTVAFLNKLQMITKYFYSYSIRIEAQKLLNSTFSMLLILGNSLPG